MEKDNKDKPRRDLPEIPDYPDAPLPAWKHYGITNYAGQRILDEIDHVQYTGYLIGMEIAYTVKEEKTYSMAFGKIDIPDEVLKKFDGELPLTDEFLSNLFRTVGALVYENAPDYQDEMDTELIAVISGSAKKVKVKCRKVKNGECTEGHVGKKKICKSTDNGSSWTCLHDACS